MIGDKQERADDHVLGIWGHDTGSVEDDLQNDPEFLQEVGRSRDRFLPLDDTADPLAPSDDLWRNISSGIDDSPVLPPVEGRGIARGRPSAARAERKRPWLAYALAASLVFSAVLGWMVVTEPDPQVVAVLVNDDGNPFALIGTNERNVTQVTILSAVDIPNGRIMQVWTKPDPDGPPVSVGLIEQVESLVLRSPELPPPTVDQLYEITIEQEGGSPTGLPTGEILGKGFTQPRL
ncbi:anti-sigma factor domain-containing protein [Marivita sp. S2033]|uniref:anti-sigma factor n=1 Tax=Marivita sp. S2033 TaxID=3373187 RepID=UPI0039829DE5